MTAHPSRRKGSEGAFDDGALADVGCDATRHQRCKVPALFDARAEGVGAVLGEEADGPGRLDKVDESGEV